ncbi:MAG TPA: acetolactate synthase small subunit [Candidatus Mediterraneibacter stercorigallinarum]|uniref:Acetolactate synthase small subunit n=1 Tax=Candidatus Mediterraneibacter stercorigallinarum TaxID=2838686 RepID=A0A9D2D9K4_9FIRM|nr:acetolactate synthase small subunit [Candidatus Mediterraneibacter stercorigallinarum]
MHKKRWISLLVENDVGVLANISGLFSGKSYNLDSLTAGTTTDRTISRMTISLTSDDQTFEQIKKQLNRNVDIIKVTDFTDTAIHMKELMYLKIIGLKESEMGKVERVSEVFGVKMIDYGVDSVLLECVQTEKRNSDLVELCVKLFGNRVDIVRGGSVAIEAISISER